MIPVICFVGDFRHTNIRPWRFGFEPAIRKIRPTVFVSTYESMDGSTRYVSPRYVLRKRCRVANSGDAVTGVATAPSPTTISADASTGAADAVTMAPLALASKSDLLSMAWLVSGKAWAQIKCAM